MASSSHAVAPHLKSLIGAQLGSTSDDVSAAQQRLLNLWNDPVAWDQVEFTDRLRAKEEQVDIEDHKKMGFDPTVNTVTEVTDDEPDTQEGQEGPKPHRERKHNPIYEREGNSLEPNTDNLLREPDTISTDITSQGNAPGKPLTGTGTIVNVPLTDTEDEMEAIVEARMAAEKKDGQSVNDLPMPDKDSDEEQVVAKMTGENYKCKEFCATDISQEDKQDTLYSTEVPLPNTTTCVQPTDTPVPSQEKEPQKEARGTCRHTACLN